MKMIPVETKEILKLKHMLHTRETIVHTDNN